MARIVVLSDIHLSPTHGFFWENWCLARNFADATKADAVIVNGDVAINGPDSDAEIEFAAAAIEKLQSRVMTLPGNHDVGDEPPGQDPDQIIDADRIARWDRSFDGDRWAMDAGSWRLVGVNAQLFVRPRARESAGSLARRAIEHGRVADRAVPAQAALSRKPKRRRRDLLVHGAVG
ncbi:MAG: metallophosphoesterase [Planctomycetaceae bacterium]|nr:metallophosphoesterase [Planctomycetaceae bacterium]